LYGGVEMLLATLARSRDLCPSMESHFALCFEGRLSAELTAASAPLHLIGNVRVRWPLTVWRARRRFSDLLRRTRFDLVVCHSPWSQAIFGPVVRLAGLPLVFWLHDAISGWHWLERWARLTPPDLALCCSEYTAGKLANVYPLVPAELIHHPVVLAKSQHSSVDRLLLRAALDTPKDATVIVQVSRMERWKGHSLHLQALSLLKDLPDWVSWQVGGAQRPHELRYVEDLKKQTARLGIASRVRFLGERSDVPQLLAAADIHCQPNLRPEPFGITFVEALMAGLPVVTTAFGGAKEIVDESCGILVPPGDAQALAVLLRRLINDRGLRTRLGAAGPMRAHKLCDSAAQMSRLNDLFNRAVQAGRR
jgi:glycosyltransferase involved in cell wall biosynthesis